MTESNILNSGKRHVYDFILFRVIKLHNSYSDIDVSKLMFFIFQRMTVEILCLGVVKHQHSTL